MKRYLLAFIPIAAAAIVGAVRFGSTKPIDQESFEALYDTPAPGPETSQNVFHLGHSLIGPDIPVMLKQLAGSEHTYSSQLGWGTTLKAHWEPEEPINGFELRSMPDRYGDAKEAISSGDYNTLVLTEMVEIRDAIKYFDSGKYLYQWSNLARQSNKDTRIFFYETWHPLDDEEGWLERLDKDLERYWEKEILRRALAYEEEPEAIYLIPAGQVMAKFVREVESRGGVGPVRDRNDLFSDSIHLSDFGNYLVALTHYAVIYQSSPVGLPYELLNAEGADVENPGPEVAKLMQETVWDVVQRNPRTGLPRN